MRGPSKRVLIEAEKVLHLLHDLERQHLTEKEPTLYEALMELECVEQKVQDAFLFNVTRVS